MSRLTTFSSKCGLAAAALVGLAGWTAADPFQAPTVVSGICGDAEPDHLTKAEACRALAQNPDLSAQSRAAAHWRAGKALFKLRERGEARAHFNRATDLYPGNALLWLWQSENLFYFGDIDAAMTVAETALSLYPSDLDLQGWQGTLLWMKGQHQRAEPRYLRMLEANPEEVWVRQGLSTIRHIQGRYQESAEISLSIIEQGVLNGLSIGGFLGDCWMLKEACPPLYPETRSERPKMSCEYAREFIADQIAKNGRDMEWLVKVHRASNEDSAIYSHASMDFIHVQSGMFVGDTERGARDTIILDRVLQCTVQYYVDSPEFDKELFDDFNSLFTPEMRENYLDVAHLILRSVENGDGSPIEVPRGGGFH